MVEGTISLLGYTTHALFDPGATHFFISSAFAYKLNQFPESPEFQLVISILLGVEMISSTIYKDCELMISEVKTYIDLLRLRKMEFDIILGMDWLSACRAYVDCCEKRVIFRMKGI